MKHALQAFLFIIFWFFFNTAGSLDKVQSGLIFSDNFITPNWNGCTTFWIDLASLNQEVVSNSIIQETVIEPIKNHPTMFDKAANKIGISITNADFHYMLKNPANSKNGAFCYLYAMVYYSGHRDDPIDAMRHCTFSGCMAMMIGKKEAEVIAKNHETEIDPDYMDHVNNRHGIRIGTTLLGKEKPSVAAAVVRSIPLKNACKQALDDGLLKYYVPAKANPTPSPNQSSSSPQVGGTAEREGPRPKDIGGGSDRSTPESKGDSGRENRAPEPKEIHTPGGGRLP